ncbi:MAG: hypothetical protein ABI091_00405 [Ferruginibacter sp.]
MSEISVLSNQYNKLAETSDKVNNSVIVYKKKKLLSEPSNLKKYPKLFISSDDSDLAKNTLLSFLTNLKQILEEDRKESDFIPSIVLEDYKKKLDANQYLKEDIESLISFIDKDQVISEENISILDGIMSVLDSERNILFRKLRTARG